MASRIVNMTIPEALVKEADKIAKKEGRTRSELIREAVRHYVKHFESPKKDASGLLARLAETASKGPRRSAEDIDAIIYRKDW